jgi:outer membrane protein assembly factor BamE
MRTPELARALAPLLLASLAGCSYLPSLPSMPSLPAVSGESFLGVITPYRLEIVQGNVVTSEMAAGLKEGLSRAQARELLGSPLLTDVFHADRWDYVFTIRRQGTPYQQRRVTLRFEGDLLKSFEADELPSEREFIASIDTLRTPSKPAVLALTDDQLKALPPPAAPPRSAVPAARTEAPQGPARTYPPLESTP